MKVKVVAAHSASVWTDNQMRYDLRLEGCLSCQRELRLSQTELGFPVAVDDELEITISHPATCMCGVCLPSPKEAAESGQGGPIRLACCNCGREDFDRITEAGLLKAINSGWQDIEPRIGMEDGSEFDGPLTDGNWSHLGWCPECAVKLAAMNRRQ